MDKSTLREVNKAKAFAAINPAYAATSLATLMRSAPSSRAATEIEEIIDELNLKSHLVLVNGCFIPKNNP